MSKIKNLIRGELILISFFILGLSHLAQALPGDLDLTFGGVGWVTTDFNRTFDEIRALAIQENGKIVAAGRAGNNFGLARYNFNGSLDSTFGDNGKVTTNFGGSFNEMFDMALQPDGRIVVAGRFDDLSHNVDFIVARYNSNGTLDTTFGSNGKVLTDFSGSNTSDEIASAVAIQTDGKIVVAGSSDVNDPNDFALARYNSDGTLDSTFGNEGIVTTDFNNGSIEGILAVVIQADGKIVAAGYINFDDFALVRYNSDGSLDTTFGVGGKVTTDFGSSSDTALDIAIQTDGKIVVIGFTVPLGHVDFAIARYNSDGSLDATFGTGGKVITNFDTNSNDSTFREDFAEALAIQEDGKIVVAGFTSITIIDGNTVTGGDNDFALARYNSNGSLDSTFGHGGKVITNFGLTSSGNRSDDYAFAVAIQKNNGKMVVGGRSNINRTHFAVARYHGYSCNGFNATRVGTMGDDSLRGTPSKDVIVGLGGNDTIYGFAGNDVICAGEGNDTVKGGKGHDTILGGKGNDTLLGQLGNDTLEGWYGDDKLKGGNGTDTCAGGPHVNGDTAIYCETVTAIP